jgi:exodeoxyribonuclease V alpha subunit
MHRGEAGTEALNRVLQAVLNPPVGDARELPRGPRAPLRVGDKVMQSRNDYERDVFNGDVGEVVSVDVEEGTAEVAFDDRRVTYEGESLEQLELAYAVSVHKSQGSEYPAVVVVILPQHFVLLRRNLLYTAITRGKKLVVLVGAQRAIRRAVETADTERRWTRLADRLRDAPSSR